MSAGTGVRHSSERDPSACKETADFKEVIASLRIGIDYAGEDAFLPWRFTLPIKKVQKK